MRIDIYTLLGLVKDGKAPKKIKYSNVELEYDEECGDYYSYYGQGLFEYKFGNCKNFLNDKAEIIEEQKKIEKIEMYQDEEGHYFLNKQDRKIYVNCDEMDFMVDKFNELIDEINNLKLK